MPPARPFTDHETAVFDVPVTLAVKRCDPLVNTVAAVGETDTAIVGGVGIVTLALADLEVSAALVAVIVTEFPEGAVAGAW